MVDLFEMMAWLRRRQPFGAPAWLLVAVLLVTLLRRRPGSPARPGVVVTCYGLLLVATALMVLGGHIGGRITFGDR